MASVEIVLTPWIGDHAAGAGESHVALIMSQVWIDGLFTNAVCQIIMDGIAKVVIDHPDPGLRARYGPSEFLDETTDDKLVLPITELLFR